MSRGGNGIVVIEGDRIVDDGLKQSLKSELTSLFDDSQIRQQLQEKLQYTTPENIFPQMPEINFETIVTPLSSIENLVGQILTAIGNREPQQVNVSPNVDIDLGGAYVFDNDLKMSLVEDITNRIVTEITSAVEKATSQRTYGFNA